jgi:uncharacterized lipoprotein NlpE involved in copper resistance
VIEDMVQAGV